jgi:hypothetical protein
MDGERRLELEQGKGKRRQAVRGRRGGRGCFFCRSGGGEAWWAGMELEW